MGFYVTPRSQEVDSNGDPLVGAKLYFYEAGTSTLKDTYTNETFATPNTNPVISDSSGRFSTIYLNGEYKVILKDSDDNEIWSEDNIRGSSNDLFFTEVELDSSTTIDSSYENKHIICTGTITLSILSAVTAGRGFVISVVNNGSGIVTLNPSGSEEINNKTTWYLPPNGNGILICTGSTWSFLVNNDGTGLNSQIPIVNASGTVDVITATYDPPITLTDKQIVSFVASGANTTTTPTFNPNGLGAYTIVRDGGQPLNIGDIPRIEYVALLQLDLTNTYWELLNPSTYTQRKGADVASDTALPIITDGNYADVTGTTTITTIDTTGRIGTVIKLHFDDAVTIEDDADYIILNMNGENYTTTAGDELEFVEYDTGKFIRTGGARYNGESFISSYNVVATIDSDADWDNLTTAGIYKTEGTGYTNSPLYTSSTDGYLRIYNIVDETQIIQEWTESASGDVWRRSYDGTNWGIWKSNAYFGGNVTQEFWDFLEYGEGATVDYGLNTTASGTSAATTLQQSVVDSGTGAIRLGTGTDSTGNASVYSYSQTYYAVFLEQCRIEARLKIPTVSDATDGFSTFFGMSATTLAQRTTNNVIGLFCEDSENSGNWTAVTDITGTETSTDTGVAPTEDVFQKLRIEASSDATSIYFFIDDVLVATHTTNIPTVQLFAANCSVQKTSGSTVRYVYVDYIYIQKLRT